MHAFVNCESSSRGAAGKYTRHIHTCARACTHAHTVVSSNRLFHFNIVRLPVIIATYTFALYDITIICVLRTSLYQYILYKYAHRPAQSTNKLCNRLSSSVAVDCGVTHTMARKPHSHTLTHAQAHPVIKSSQQLSLANE